MAGPIRISILANASQARREFSQVSRDADGLGSKLGKFGKIAGAAAATGLAAAGAAGVALVKSSVSAASDAQQSLGATEAIFGKYADTVIKKSDEAAQSVGLSANAYRESSNLLGALFKNQGTDLDKLSGKTDKHLKLAADLSAMYGGDVTESVEALTAAYKGEFNQLEKYGVTLKQDTINTEANAVAKQKYGKELKDLTPEQESLAKQLATQKLLFKQTADATGTFADEADTLAGQTQRASAEFDNMKVKIGNVFLPAVTSAMGWINSNALPALEDLGAAVKDAFDNKGGAEKGGILGALADQAEASWSVLQDVWDGVKRGWDELMGSFESIGKKHGPMLNQIADAFGEVADQAEKYLGPALSWLAEEGLDLLGFSLERFFDNIKLGGNLLFDFAGAVLAIAGPIVGTFGDIANAALTVGIAAAEVFDALTPGDQSGPVKALKNIRDEINTMTDDFEKNAPKMRDLLNEQQWEWNLTAAQAKELGNAIRLLPDDVETVIKTPGAVDSVAKITELQKKYDLTADEVVTVMRAAGADLSIKEVKRLTEQYGFTPEQVTTVFATSGGIITRKEVAALQKLFDLTPKQVRTLFKAEGVEKVVGQGRSVKKILTDVGATKATTGPWQRSLVQAITGGKQTASKGRTDINGVFNAVGANARPNLNPFASSLSGQITRIKNSASGSASSIGSAMGAGIYNGMDGWASTIADRAASIVRGAVSAAKAAGAIHSPSKETRYIGEMLGAGLALGMHRATPKARAAARRLVRTLVKDGKEGVGKLLADTSSFIRQGIDLKDDKAEKAREKRVIKSLKDEYKALRRNAKAQDANTKKLTAARDKLKELQQEYKDYSATIKESIIASGNVTELGMQEGGGVSITSLLNEMRDKVNQAKRFAFLIQDLTKKGLTRTSIQQMLDAGPEAALATAEAIASGGASAITEINTLQAQLAATGDQLGGAMAEKYYGAGVDAAAGIVKGLEAEAKRLDKAAVKLANELVRAVKKALGIKSPSKVFAGVGDQVVKGLDIGLDDTYVKRSGAQLAYSLEKGFGTPALAAYASARAAESGNTVHIRLTAQQLSQLQRGREIQADLDAYRAAGGRARA